MLDMVTDFGSIYRIKFNFKLGDFDQEKSNVNYTLFRV